jgi:hypothetical protein
LYHDLDAIILRFSRASLGGASSAAITRAPKAHGHKGVPPSFVFVALWG